MAKQKQGTPPWVTLGCGCCLFVLVAIGAFVAAGYFGVSAVKDYVEDLKDPAARAVKAAELLGTPQLPEGYAAQIYLRIPWVLDLVILSDGAPTVPEDDDFDFDPEHITRYAFVYFALRQGTMDEEEIDDMLRGRRAQGNVKVDVGVEVESEEEVARGEFEIESQRLRYVAHRGEVSFGGDAVPGTYSRLLIECPGDQLTRVALWFERQPQVIGGIDTPAAPGSPADEEALREFMGHFDLCAG